MSKQKNNPEEIEVGVSGNSAEETAKEKNSGNAKKLKYGSMSIITIALVIVIVIIINIMAGIMEKRTPLKLDLTADNRYELSDETIDFLRNDLNQDIDIIVTCKKEEFANIEYNTEAYYRIYAGMDVDVPYSMIPIILEKYQMYANQGKGKINVKYVDLQNDPKALASYEKYYSKTFSDRSIIIYSNERVRVIDTDTLGGMITFDQKSTSATPAFVFAGESVITSEIMNVVDAHPVRVALAATVNGETIYDPQLYENGMYSCYKGLKDELLSKNGYDVEEIDIATDELDTEKYDMVVIPMPYQDFDEKIINKLSDFLYNDENYGKDLLYIADLPSTNLTNIDEFLKDWSIEVAPQYIYDTGDNYFGNSETIVYARIADNEDYADIDVGSLPAAAYTSRLVNVLSRNNESIASAVIESYDTAVSRGFDEGSKPGSASAKPIAVVSKRQHQNKTDQFAVDESNVMVLGCGFMTDTKVLSQTKLYSNASMLLGVLNKMTGKEAAVIIPEKSLQQAVIAPTAKQTKTIRLITVYIIPAVIVILGLFVLLRRRNK